MDGVERRELASPITEPYSNGTAQSETSPARVRVDHDAATKVVRCDYAGHGCLPQIKRSAVISEVPIWVSNLVEATRYGKIVVVEHLAT